MPKKATTTFGQATRSQIRKFYQIEAGLELENDGGILATYAPYEYYDHTNVAARPIVQDGQIPNFPFLFQGDGSPWVLGNLYLMDRFDEDTNFKTPSVATYKSIAGHLIDFRKFIERLQAEQTENNPDIKKEELIDEFYMPRHKARRVTYRYRADLVQRMKNGEVAPKTAQNRINRVVKFYRMLKEYLGEEVFDYPPYKDVMVGINTKGQMGANTLMRLSSDLAISGGATVSPNVDGTIVDGGQRLRPLQDGYNNDEGVYVEGEQDFLHKGLEYLGNYTFQLVSWVMLFTGVRTQTALTLRIKNLRNAYDKKFTNVEGEYVIPVGMGTEVDIKNGMRSNSQRKMYVPAHLMELLLGYADSPYHRECMEQSFYGVSDENYLFLSSRGNAYYTSEREKADRKNPIYSQRIDIADAQDYPITEGDSLRGFYQRLNKHIQAKHREFQGVRPHFLRATYGVNRVRLLLDAGYPRSKIVNDIQGRMWHENPQTTMGYLDFTSNQEFVTKAHEGHSDKVFEVAKTYGLWGFEGNSVDKQ